jgi:hypothetical protein
MRVSSRLLAPIVALVAAVLAAGACASVPASRVRAVPAAQASGIGPLLGCGYYGRVQTVASGETDQDLLRLREEAGRRGANTVVFESGVMFIEGKAFQCPTSYSSALALTGGDSGPYGPAAPSVQGYPKGLDGVAADPRH